MKSRPFYFEIKDMLTQFVAAFDDIVIGRFNRNREEKDRINVRYVYAPKQRVLYDIINENKTLTLPVVSVNVTGVSRDETRVLLHLDLGAHTTPELLTPKRNRIEKKNKTVVEVLCNSQCPWCGWMADNVNKRVSAPNIRIDLINTDSRGTIEEHGLARGISINGVPIIKRMAAWKEIKSATLHH